MKLNKNKDLLFFILIIIVSAILIFYKFNQIPQHLAFDEALFAKIAVSLDNKPYIPFSSFADGHATVYFYILLWSFKLFGLSSFALRLPNAVFGILSVGIFYLVLRKAFKKSYVLSFFLALVFLTSHWYFNFVRFSFETPYLLFIELLSIFFLVNYLEKKNLWFLVGVGILSGLAYNSYQPGRIFFLLPLASLFLTKQKLKSYLYFIIPFVITITPLTIYLAKNPQSDIRINQQLFLKNSQLSVQKKASWLWENFSKAGLMFHIKGDGNGRHNYPYKPALNPIMGVFFLLGMIIAVLNIKQFYNQFFLLYFFLAMLPSLITYPWENPNMLRTFTALPSITYLIGVGVLFIKNLKFLKNKKMIINVAFIVLFFLSSAYELRTYFKYQSQVFPGAFQVRCPLPELVKIIKFNVLAPPHCRN